MGDTGIFQSDVKFEFYKLADYGRLVYESSGQRKAYLEIRDEIRKVFVYSVSPGLGDLIISIPFFEAIKHAFPEAKVYFLGKIHPRLRGLFESISYIDSYLFYCPRRSLKGVVDFITFHRSHRDEGFDLLIDTQRQFLPSLALRILRPRYMLGYSCSSFFSDWKVFEPDRRNVHVLAQLVSLLRALGIEEFTFEPRINLQERYLEAAGNYLGQKRSGTNLVGLIPGAANRTKCWPANSFAELGNYLSKRYGFDVIIFGGSGEEDILRDVAGAMKRPSVIPILDDRLFLDDLVYSAALMSKCKFIIGNDCGGIHLATAVGRPVIAIYGPTRPTKFGPLGDRNIVVNHRPNCSPCKKGKCRVDRRCLKEIKPEEVIGAAEFLMREMEK